MTFENERKYIEEEFSDNWTSSTTPIKYSNVNGLVKGTSIVKDSTGLSQWCRLEIVNTNADNVVVGGGTIRHEGEIVVNIFVKTGTGTDTARELCDDVIDIFNNKTFDDVNCTASIVTTEGDIDGFFMMSVSTPYYRDA